MAIGNYSHGKLVSIIRQHAEKRVKKEKQEGRLSGTSAAPGVTTMVQYNRSGITEAAENLRYDPETGYTGMGVAGADINWRLTLPNTAGVAGGICANSFSTYSSRRYKEDVGRIDKPYAMLEKIEGVRFNWKESGQQDLGFIAEDVGKIIPEAVTWEEDGEDAMSLDYTKVVPILVEVVKEQHEKMISLQNQVDGLLAELSRVVIKIDD